MKQITYFNPKMRELLLFTPLQYMLDSIEENPTLAQLFVDDEIETNTCCVLYGHYLFVCGNVTQAALGYLFDERLTDKVREDLEAVFVFYGDEKWKDAIMNLFSENIYESEKSLYRMKPTCTQEMKCNEDVVAITAELMDSNTANLEMITEEVIGTATYNGMEDFFVRGIGYAPVIDNKVCGFCTSEYPSKDEVAIGIEVLEEYQKQGYAKTMTKAFLYKAAQRGLSVNWDCWKKNTASVNTAKACGFEKIADYPVVIVEF